MSPGSHGLASRSRSLQRPLSLLMASAVQVLGPRCLARGRSVAYGMVMAGEETFESPKDVHLFVELALASLKKGGVTPADLSRLSKRFGVSEDLLLRHERAGAIYKSVIYDKLLPQARVEAMRRLIQRGKDPMDDEFGDELRKAYDRLQAALSENAIVREFKEAKAAIRAALGEHDVQGELPG